MEAHLRQINRNQTVAKQSHEIKKKQELEFMDRMKELEENERERYKTGRKKVMSDLNMIN